MIQYLILLLVALIIFPIVLLFFKKYNTQQKVMILAGGLFIAFIGIFIQSTLSFYYSALIMFGLTFALAVLFTKQIEKKNQENDNYEIVQTEPVKITEVVKAPIDLEPTEKPLIKQEDWLKPARKEEQ